MKPTPSHSVLVRAAAAIALCLPSAALAQFCENFNTGTAGWIPHPNSPNVSVTTALGGPGGPTDPYLRVGDLSGASALQASAAFMAAWNAMSCCGTCCWDVKIFDDGAGSSLLITPQF